MMSDFQKVCNKQRKEYTSQNYTKLGARQATTVARRVVDMSKLKDTKDVSGVDTQAFNIPGIMAALGSLSESDFNYVQEKSLDVCSEVLLSGLTPVRNSNGSFGVIGLEEDTMAVMALTVHALIFNVKGFFQGSPLASIVGGLLNTSQQDSST
jgi:hypothetical protein